MKRLYILITVLSIIHVSHATTFTVNDLGDGDDGTFATPFTLRKCIRIANVTAGATSIAPHQINFSVAGTITLLSNLPVFITPIYINGSTAPGYTARTSGGLATRTPGTAGTLGTPAIPTITLVGFSILQNNAAAAGSRFRGLAINNANPHAFDINGVNTLIIEECNIGINATGTTIAATAAHGILLNNSSGTIIRNNIISGSGAHGILAINSPNMYIFGNFIGCNRAGTAAVPNSAFGMLLLDACNNIRIGGLSSDSSNLISGNTQIGIGTQGSAKSNIYIINNYIGVTKAGTAALGNQFGINEALTNTLIIKNNVVCASAAQGIYCYQGSGLIMKGNYVGVNVTGTALIKNNSNNVDLNETHGAIIGGSLAGEGNVLTGTNSQYDHGLILQGGARTNNCIIKGNYIGTNALGKSIGAGTLGYGLVVKGSNNIIGGNLAGEANIISGNGGAGILLTDGSNNQVIGNRIGVDKDLLALGNGYAGILIRREDAGFPTQNNIIKNNIIAYNGTTYPVNPTNPSWVLATKGPGIGVSVAEYGTSNTDAIQHTLTINSIYCNAGLGISLNKLETTPGYGNINKASPVINKPASTNTFTTGTAAALDSIEVYANPGSCDCQAEVLLGKTKADGAGNWSLAHASADRLYITALARDASNNTSELTVCTVLLPVELLSFTAKMYQPGISTIQWQTSAEVNNHFFTIEKSIDGKKFYSIGKVDGHGTTSEIQSYSFLDINFTEAAYYRLRQIDYDGKNEVSQLVYLDLSSHSLSVYPNPVTDHITVSGNAPVDSNVKITLFNSLGQLILLQDLHTSADFFNTSISVSTLPAGFYTITVTGEDSTFTEKIIKE